MAWHGYILISHIPPGWTVEQRDQAWGVMRGLGSQSNSNPAKINHSRLSLDNDALIIEAEFSETEITVNAVANAIGAALGINPAAAKNATEYTVFAEGESWENSREAAALYIAANYADWDTTI